MWFIYYASMYLFVLGIRISALWDAKSNQWIRGRRNWETLLRNSIRYSPCRVWFHVSSLGEFEQARPVIEELKRRGDPEIIVSFFSPSGFEIKKDYPNATITYLPADLPGNAEKFLEIVQPSVAVFVKYDLWPGFLKALSKKDVPCILISAHWSPSKKWSSHSMPLTRRYLHNFKKIFLQKKAVGSLSESLAYKMVIAGDTRIDRSLLLPTEVMQRLPASLLNTKAFDVVAGSTWHPDEALLIEVADQLDLKIIIAPHDVALARIEDIEKKTKRKTKRLSQLSTGDIMPDILIVDSIGLLSVLYALGKVAYVGGGFGKGIHNLLEPAAHGKPVIFGPRYDRFPEARELIQAGGGFSFRHREELRELLSRLSDLSGSEEAGGKAKAYLQRNAGASFVIADYILDILPCAGKK